MLTRGSSIISLITKLVDYKMESTGQEDWKAGRVRELLEFVHKTPFTLELGL